MSAHVTLMPVFLSQSKTEADSTPEHVKAAYLQEQFTGPIPRRTERRMTEILKERLAKTKSDKPAPVFIP